MKRILVVFFVSAAIAAAQTATGSISGKILDAKTLKPISTAWVVANHVGTPPFVKNTKSGGDGGFQVQGLTAGAYSLCVQAPGDRYLDPCQWNGSPTTVTLTSGQAASGLMVKLTAASILSIQVQDPVKALSQVTKDGRRPELSLGVWGPKGLFYPAHLAGPGQQGGTSYAFQLAVPFDTALKFHIASHDLKLGDATGVAFPAAASPQAFLHATGDANPKSFAFTVLSLLP